MQGTIDIMSIMQKNNLAKQKPITASFGSSTTESSFKAELLKARKNTAANSSANQPTDHVRQETVKDNKVEKLAKVMSNNKTVTDKVENVSSEAPAEKLKTVESQAADDAKASNSDLQTAKPIDEEKLDPDTVITELVESAQELLQQLMQLISGTNAEVATQENVKQIEASIQAISQKLEQILKTPADTNTEEADVVLKNLKVDLKELIKQLKTQTNVDQPTVIDKPSLQQTVNTIKQLISKMNEVKPILQQKLAKSEAITENAEQKPELAVNKAADNKAADNKAAIKQSDEGIKAKAADSNTKENTEKDSKDSDKESKNKVDVKDASKHQVVDKHKLEAFKLINAMPNDKAQEQINVRELNLNLKKDQMVAINKSDIVNQVVKKADIIVREGHSEMIMKLEPESLGKLNLKIVVEKGLITAKFIAESQQVKEVLESSFGQLKDALQEKGIAVQNFSVSVGQQAGDSSSNQSFNQWKQTIKLKNKAVGEFMGIDDEAVTSQNPYSYHDGKVDYRA